MLPEVGLRLCYICKRCLPEDLFPRDASKGSGFKSCSRHCDNEKSRRYYEANREKRLAYHRGRAAVKTPKMCVRCGKHELKKRRYWYCPQCKVEVEKEKEKLRGPRSPEKRDLDRQRYDRKHRIARRIWKRIIAHGGVACWRCGQLISSDEPWDLGHSDEDPTKHAGPEHARCNRATAGRRKPERETSREW